MPNKKETVVDATSTVGVGIVFDDDPLRTAAPISLESLTGVTVYPITTAPAASDGGEPGVLNATYTEEGQILVIDGDPVQKKKGTYNKAGILVFSKITLPVMSTAADSEEDPEKTTKTTSLDSPVTSSAKSDASSLVLPTATDTDSSAAISQTGEPNSSSDGLSGGAVAGVAIGCLVAGLALGAILAFILFRRRQKRNHAPASFIKAEQQSPELKGGPQVTVTTSRNDADLGQFLLETTPDKDIQGELRSLSELIYQHVENHYHGLQVQVDPAEVAQSLVDIGYSPESSGLQADTIAAVCLAPKTRQVGLRHVISHIIFQSLDFSSSSSFSMLPLAVVALSQTSHSAENSNSPVTRTAISLARSKWRCLTALLLHPAPNERTSLPVSMAEASPKAQSLANELNAVMQLFVAQDAASRQDQASHLQAVILECTQLGYVVLSQSSDWRFVFSNSSTSTKPRRIMVCPGLEKLSHHDGTRYGSPKEVVAPETMPL
ncbi:hypothetical protein FSARC_10114 [Fusarium sarcochroum]|uniref:Uncharacterized protein n=1 Tax=Fusarium sarcochroum TaxID=1208366 RepID=A0A8H4X5D9_9HYPO|nr:hypothetical protein FSARC_10114 [Fusarium sarcochroum]